MRQTLPNKAKCGQICTFGAYLGAPNMIKWSVSEKILQNAVQTRSYRSGQLENDVDAKKDSNAFFKHLRLFHPDAQGGIENFDIRVMSVHKKPLTRQKTEAVKIASSTATNLLNSKAEHRQPALIRVRMVQGDDNDVQGPTPGPGGAGDGGGGGGGEGRGE